jgi:3',5'-cyclic AMP phosphodiesterase CpdA
MSAREMSMVRRMWAQGRWACLLTAAVLSTGCYWARSSSQPVPRLAHPPFDRVTQAVQPPFRFAIFGDQKGLAKSGEWDALLRQVSALEPPPLFLLDTGDIVENGTYRDQFVQLEEILSVVDGLPYLLAVGNHEIDDDDTAAKGHVVEFLGDVIGRDQFREERLYYAKTVGPLRLLVLDSNDLVYPARGACRERYSAGARGAEQLSWLADELAQVWEGPTVVAFHHTMILSASKHEGHARCLWNGSYAAHGERTLPEMLIDGGVDVVLTGHTHTYEVLRLTRGGRDMLSVNVSGTSGGSRLARSVSDPLTDFSDRGWDLSGWTGLSQGAFMPPNDIVNQFGLVSVDASGALDCAIYHVGESVPRPCHP